MGEVKGKVKLREEWTRLFSPKKGDRYTEAERCYGVPGSPAFEDLHGGEQWGGVVGDVV